MQRWGEMNQCPDTYYVIVIEDTSVPGGKVIGAATLVRERKFIHSCGSVGRLEAGRIFCGTMVWWCDDVMM